MKIKYGITDPSKLSTNNIKEVYDKITSDEFEDFLELFSNDERKSVISLCARVEKKIKKNKAELERLCTINLFEEKAYENGYKYIGGVDEAGRGPLAGPVVAAVVVFKRGTKIYGIDDSKKLSEDKREELFEIIKNEALDYGIGIADNVEIDENNILQATYIAMKRAIDNLKNKPDCLLNDAVKIPGVDIRQVPIIKGDSKSISIAAASILAKVTRDRMMYEYDLKYPEYGFRSNKGYGTSVHYEGLRKKGKTEIHRNSFLKNFDFEKREG